MMGAAVLACEDAGLPWTVIHLSKLKKNATGKGNATKQEMIEAAKVRFGLELDDNAADALFAACYASDHGLFTSTGSADSEPA
jgi:Holliday junction resolvasome RuvABC endonuclease subunit